MPAVCRRLLALPVLLLAACTRPDPSLVHDLAAAAPFAELRSGWEVYRPGTLESELLEEKGIDRPAWLGTGEAWSGLHARATLFLELGAPRPRRLLVDVAPEPGQDGRDLTLALDGHEVGVHRLTPGRQRFVVDLPAAGGRKRLRLTVSDPGEPTQGAHRGGGVVARLYGLVAAAAGDLAFAALADGRVASPLLADAGRFQQLAPSMVRFALPLPRQASLFFTPEWDAGCDPAMLRVQVEERGRPARVVWSGARMGSEILVGLGSEGPAWVSFEVQAPAGCAIRWKRPRILGTSAVPRIHPEPAGETPELAELRQRLKGVGVVLVVLDAARARNFGCYGHAQPTTPEIDRLAQDGIVFEEHATTAVFTYAAMGSIWMSRPPDEGGGEWLQQGFLPPGPLTLAELLSAQGIPTAAFVANPSAGSGFGLERGFEKLLSLYREPWTTGAPPTGEVFERPLGDWLAAAKPPFLAYAHLREPHMPYGAPLSGADAPLPPEARDQAFWDRVNKGEREVSAAELDHLRRLYDGNLRSGDRAFGVLRRQLEAAGLWERSVVIVTADHGEALHEHGLVGHNHQVYQESVQVPLIVRLPAGLGPRGVRRGLLTSHLDLAPTVADLLGISGAALKSFRGRSLLPALFGELAPAAQAIRTAGVRPIVALRTGPYKYVEGEGREELFDLSRDPAESRDVAGSEPLWLAVHRQMLGAWLTGLRRQTRLAAPPARIDARDEEQLRALGYLQ